MRSPGAEGTDQILQVVLYTVGAKIESPRVGAPPSARRTRRTAPGGPLIAARAPLLHLAHSQCGVNVVTQCKASWSVPHSAGTAWNMTCYR